MENAEVQGGIWYHILQLNGVRVLFPPHSAAATNVTVATHQAQLPLVLLVITPCQGITKAEYLHNMFAVPLSCRVSNPLHTRRDAFRTSSTHADGICLCGPGAKSGKGYIV